ncbi:MAG TPA: TonB-dependent receptor plug domain-containing protein, partial [Gemmatimonadaceae bacterium]|nr:TonB-dependent receptor plug domain-containing protein [Gemmatimonadaceae bacterium]
MPAPRRPSPLVALLLVGAVGSLPAQAPTVRDTVRLGPVVVTATKTDGAPAVAATVVLRGAALRERGIATVGDALREVAGVHLARSGSPGATTSLFLRGGQSNYVKVLVDGVSVNEAGGFVDAANLGTDNVERIEVVRGPTSVLYGSDAVSGVVQIFTRRPASGLHVDAAVRGGATPRKRGRPDDATPADGRSALLDATVEASGGTSRLGWSIGAARREHGGLLAFNNAWRHTAASAALVASPDARTMLRLSTRLTDGRFEYPTDGGGFAVDSNARRDERRVVLGLDAERRLGERVRLRLLAGTHELHGVSSDQPDSRADTAGFYYRTENDNWRRTL